MNTLAATSQRIPRPAQIGIAVLVVAFLALMIVRLGVLGGSDSSTTAAPIVPAHTATPTKTGTGTGTGTGTRAGTPVATKVVLLPNLPTPVAHALRYSKVVVVSVYVGQAPGDHAAVTEAQAGARSAGAGFVAVNVGNDRVASKFSSFIGTTTPPTMLVVRRPGTIVTRMPGQVERVLVAQAAHNAGARQ